jgi:hypothetical protein
MPLQLVQGGTEQVFPTAHEVAASAHVMAMVGAAVFI